MIIRKDIKFPDTYMYRERGRVVVAALLSLQDVE